MSHESTTRQNWLALQEVTLKYFCEIHARHPEWTSEGLVDSLNLPRTALFLELANKAGFKRQAIPSPEQICAVANMIMKGVWSHLTIADELKLPLDVVAKIFESQSRGFGIMPYGVCPYGGNRKVSDGANAVARRVTTAGQISYRGTIYTLGAAYRGRSALIRERGDQLLVTFLDRAPVYIKRRA